MSSADSPACLASIHIYPLKAARAVDLGMAAVEPWGLRGDRRWLLVDETGRFISQREEPAMARVVVEYDDPGGSGNITVSAAGYPATSITAPAPAAAEVPHAAAGMPGADAEMVPVTVQRSTVLAAAAGVTADKWSSEYLDRPVRLVYLDDPTRRPVDPGYGLPGDVVSFADGYPLLVTNTASLDALGDWLVEVGDEPVPMTRFRPNLVIDGPEPWAEDRWHRIRIGDVPFRIAKPCGRCVVTTIDQRTGERSDQPLKMLGQRRRFGQALVFGQNAIPDGPGTIRVGDPVHVLSDAQPRP
jgi:uncharacterized protein